MSPFPFPKLPALPLDLIFKDVNLIDTISFSLVSKSTRSIAKSLRKSVKCLKFLKDLATIRIFEHRGGYTFDWWITVGPNFEEIGNNVGRCAVKPGYYNFFYFNTSGADNQPRFYHLVVNTILDVFKADQLVLEASSVENISYFNSTVLYQLYEIQLLDDSDNDNVLSQQDLEYLLEGCLNSSSLKICVKAAENVRYPGTLRHYKMKLEIANWLSIDNILEMKCAVLSVEGATLSAQDFNRLLKTWVSGGLKNMDRCRIELADDNLIRDVFEVMEGIEPTDWRPPLISWHEGPRVPRFAEWRIRRDDGKWAIVLVTGDMVRFHIWHID